RKSPPFSVSLTWMSGGSPSPLVFTAPLMPPWAQTEWLRLTGTIEQTSTCLPASASLMTVISPDNPPPTTMYRSAILLTPPARRRHSAQAFPPQSRLRVLSPLVVAALLGAVAALVHVAEPPAVVARSVEKEPGAASDKALLANADQPLRNFILEQFGGIAGHGPQEGEQVAVVLERCLEFAGGRHAEPPLRHRLGDPS